MENPINARVVEKHLDAKETLSCTMRHTLQRDHLRVSIVGKAIGRDLALFFIQETIPGRSHRSAPIVLQAS